MVTYGEGLEPLARRAAARAERAHALLSAELLAPPRGRIDLVVTDNLDLANGYATVYPRNRIVVYAHAPVDTPELGFYEDWLELLVLHELVHVFHIDTARGVWGDLRAVLGRNPALFPSALSPGWLTEGLATHLESRFTGGGRVRGTLYEMMLRTAVLEGEFFSLDRATGDPTRWPGPSTRYVYGSLFMAHLAERHGQERVNAFLERYAGRAPYLLDVAARSTLGSSFGAAWRGWEAELRARYAALADSLRAGGLSEPEILTGEGRVAAHPRYAPDGTLGWVAATGRARPAIRLISPDGRERTLRGRLGASSFAWSRDGSAVLYGDLDFAGPYRIHSDLHSLTRDGEHHRLTRGERLAEPDPHPDGRRLVAVLSGGGTNALAIHDPETGATREITAKSLDVHWSLPRWSPDGALIAATRWSVGGYHDVVLLDSAGAVLREVTRDRAVDAAPSWSPDGRYLLFSSDRTGIANLYAYELATGELRQVTSLLTGGFEPDVSRDGRWIAFSYYRADGYHVARIPYAPSTWSAAPPVRTEVASPLPPRDYPAVAAGTRPYSPLPSLLPAAWSPLVDAGEELGISVGAGASGSDVLERHEWSAWGAVHPRGPRAEGALDYRYRGLGNPVLGLSARQEWEAAATRDSRGEPLPSALLERERSLGGSLLLVRRRWSSTGSLGVAGELVDRDHAWADPEEAGAPAPAERPLELSAAAQGSFSTVRGFALSLGPQQGGSATLRAETHRYLDEVEDGRGARGYERLIGRLRRYLPLPLPGYARHVLGLRADLGAELGSTGPGLRVGGASGAAALLPGDVGIAGRAIAFPVRGYRASAQRGNRAAVASAEYRFPLARVERGIGVLPVFLERVWGDLFADAGAAWCAGSCASIPGAPLEIDPLFAVGAELNVDLHLGFALALPLRFGVALPLHGGAGTPQGYIRAGSAF